MRETVKDQTEVPVQKIFFDPESPEEFEHLKKLNALLLQKRRGDWGLVAEIIGTARQTAEKAFLRVYSKNHFEAVDALQKVIDNRKNLLNEKN